MLAKTYNDGPSCRYREGMLVQPKLNGIRMLYNNGICVSRDGEQWSDLCLTHIKQSLKDITDVILDGELYCHGLSLQTINSRVAVVHVSPHDKEATIQYHVFDYVSREPCYERLVKLAKAIPRTEAVRLVPSYVTSSELAANKYHLGFRNDGYEGSMLRCPHSPYAIPNECGNKANRVHWLLKRKDWLDLEAIIVGIESGDGKHANTMSSFILDWEGKTFKCSSGPTDLERLEYYQLGNRLLGMRCKVEYFTLTDRGVPSSGSRITYVELPR